MKCEICHQRAAEVAIKVTRNGVEDEAYVCRACAAAEKAKAASLAREGEMPVMRPLDNAEVPEVVEAFMNAMNGVVSGLAELHHSVSKVEKKPSKVLMCLESTGVPEEFNIHGRIHLEGLFQLGELEAIHRAMHALKMELESTPIDGIDQMAHVYFVRYSASRGQALRIVAELVRQEKRARAKLLKMPARVFADSVCRALAVLKNCRMLSLGEFYDLLSPIRLAVINKFLKKLTLEDVDEMLGACEDELSEKLGAMPTDEEALAKLDEEDMRRADMANRVFASIGLNERGMKQFL